MVFMLLLFAGIKEGQSQSGKKYIRDGNKHFEQSEFDQSEIAYRKALEEQSGSFEALFNLGDALYKQDKFEDAAGEFNSLSQTGVDKVSRARSFHNLGNSLLKANRVEESIQAYKNALRNNPDDLETKYNLAYAQDLLKEQQQQQQQNNQQDSEKNQEQEKKEQEKKDQPENEDQQKQQEEEQQPEPQISKEDAKRLLEALAEDEKALQEKLKKAEARKKRVVVRKNW